MANTPVEVKRSAPAPAAKPDTLQAFRSEMERLFDRFGFGMKPFRNWLDMEPAFQVRTSFEMPSPAIDIVEEPTGYKLRPNCLAWKKRTSNSSFPVIPLP